VIKKNRKDESSAYVSKNETSAFVSEREDTEIKETIEFGNLMMK